MSRIFENKGSNPCLILRADQILIVVYIHIERVWERLSTSITLQHNQFTRLYNKRLVDRTRSGS
jgi:hypothetical protein